MATHTMQTPHRPINTCRHLHIFIREIELHEDGRGALCSLVTHLGRVVGTLDVVTEALLVFELLATPPAGETLVIRVHCHVFPDVFLAGEGLAANVTGIWTFSCCRDGIRLG